MRFTSILTLIIICAITATVNAKVKKDWQARERELESAAAKEFKRAPIGSSVNIVLANGRKMTAEIVAYAGDGITLKSGKTTKKLSPSVFSQKTRMELFKKEYTKHKAFTQVKEEYDLTLFNDQWYTPEDLAIEKKREAEQQAKQAAIDKANERRRLEALRCPDCKGTGITYTINVGGMITKSTKQEVMRRGGSQGVCERCREDGFLEKPDNSSLKENNQAQVRQIKPTGQSYSFATYAEALKKRRELNANLIKPIMGPQMSSSEGPATAKKWKILGVGEKYILYQ